MGDMNNNAGYAHQLQTILLLRETRIRTDSAIPFQKNTLGTVLRMLLYIFTAGRVVGRLPHVTRSSFQPSDFIMSLSSHPSVLS